MLDPVGETYLERLVEIPNFTQRVQKLVHPSLVVLDKRVQAHHVLFLRIGRFVCQVLQHLGDLYISFSLLMESFGLSLRG
jgi:hypothetical protein